MSVIWARVDYRELNARQKENYNFAKVSSVLADYGFTTMRLSDDWQGADFIAQHIDGQRFLRVQLKGRLSFAQTYRGKGLYVAFFNDPDWYIYPHDELLNTVLANTGIAKTDSWEKHGGYSFPGLSREMARLLEPFKIEYSTTAGVSESA
jgi:hypothetical protein